MHLLCTHEGQQIHARLDREHAQVIVGRHRDCDMVVKNPKISRRHCQIRWTPEGVTIKDLGSSGGTYVNDRKIGRARIKPGDAIKLADVVLQLRDGDEPDWNDPQVRSTEGYDEDNSGGVPEPPRPAHELTWELHYEDEQGERQVKEIRDTGRPIILGRKSDCDIRLVNPTVGRHHCRVSVEGGDLTATDLDSSNGMFINGEKARRGRLVDGDVLECGTAEVKIRLVGGVEEEDYVSDTWHDEPMEDEIGPPNWFLVFTDADGRITTIEMAMKLRVLAIGGDDACEICVPDRGMEDEHIEMTWEHGVLVVRDLGTAVGTVLNGREVDEVVLRNGDVITCGEFQVHIVRGSSGEVARVDTGKRSQDADFWAPILTRHEDGLSMTYIDTDPYDDTRKRELTVWGDGEASLELVTRGEKETRDARVSSTLLDALFDALVRAGFPDVPSDTVDPEEAPPELEVYLDSEASNITLSRRVLERSAVYKEVAHILNALLSQARG